MTVEKILKQQIKQYLVENPVDRSKKNPYNVTAELFGVSTDQIRRLYCQLRKAKLVPENYKETAETGQKSITGDNSATFNENVEKGTAEATAIVEKDIRSLQELVEVCKIDLNEWEISRWLCNKWAVGAKNSKEEIVVTPLFQVKAWLNRRKLDTDLGKQKELILKELFEKAPKFDKFISVPDTSDKKYLYEISLFDLHFGKLAWGEESGENYDLKIAEKRAKEAIKSLLDRVDLRKVEKILFPLGNDLIHIDYKDNMTVNKTVQDVDCRFLKIIKIVKRILIEIINELSTIAPVDIITVMGNHDATISILMSEILESYYYNNDRIHVDNSPKSRKYYKYGCNGIQLTHGNEENHKDLGLIFATEEPQIWASTTNRECQLGHLHKNKKTNWVSVDTYTGFCVQILPSLSSADAWHYKKGYLGLKQAKGLLYHKTEGRVGEFTSTV